MRRSQVKTRLSDIGSYEFKYNRRDASKKKPTTPLYLGRQSRRKSVVQTPDEAVDQPQEQVEHPLTFSRVQVEQMLNQNLQNYLADLASYNAALSSLIVSELANKIKDNVKSLGYHRYKFVVQVHLGESRQQGIEVASRAIWNPTTDNMASVTVNHKGMFAVATVYGIYYD